eukprot:gnl/MRDRNA2_/MRDRNA2_33787_c0_seq1.p1 gnl/MRDRNA2_/MRDRNA2_33787_c0~~gnl/MRDRNA2_/MRDRNA2_33787_c0_seq1.p1  ORF type:complete len:953 (+),score=145.64 gnl/MRDRNA2_/MRDRNA2_33787_c0_seq1:58-2859(+)
MTSALWARLQQHVQKGAWKNGLDKDNGRKNLYIVATDKEHSWAGQYVPHKGQRVNGLNIWMKEGGEYWLYSCTDGTWGICGRDVKERRFKGNSCFVYSAPHKNASPEKVSGSWTWYDAISEQWITDGHIKVFRNVPSSLNVSTPRGQTEKSGLYTLVSGIAPNGLPLWRKRDDEGSIWWMYSGTEGTWCIGGADVKEKNFACSSGFIFSKSHKNKLPHETSGVWTRLDEEEEQWVVDGAISVFGNVPSRLHVALPNGPHLVAGEYRLVVGQTANGRPLWKKVGKDFWLYSCKDETWGIGGLDVKEKDFDCRAGFIFSALHYGEMPDKMNGSWMRFNTGGGGWNSFKTMQHNSVDILTQGALTQHLGQQKWQEDESITVFSDLPTELYVALPNGPEYCGGQYSLQVGTAANGEPVWKKVGSDFWLYSCTDGTWAIGAVDVSLKKFKCQSGFVFSNPHGGATPDKTSGHWSRYHEKQRRWVEDPSVGVFANVPAKLHVVLPNGPRPCIGEYVQVPAAVANGQPLWRKVGGNFWLASLPDGTWGICGGDVAENGFYESASFVYSVAHQGEMPHKLVGSWTRATPDQCKKDATIAVFGDVPQTLHFALPNGPDDCAGRYNLVVDETANDQPVWRHKDGNFWLFSCIDGTWGIGGDDVRRQGWTDQSAYVYSTPHEGEMPDKLGGTWTVNLSTRVQDSSIGAFSDVSEDIHVALPGELKVVSGRYALCTGKSVNDQPLWKKVDGDYWLYSCLDGTWGIGGLDVKEKRFKCSAGFIYSASHDGAMPDKLTSSWRRWCPKEGKLLKDSGIAVFSAAPQALHVSIPSPGLEALRGEYELILGEAANGMPVWRKVGGDYWFFSCIDSSWGIGGTDVKEKKFKCSLSFIYSAVHNGSMPHKMEGSWNRWDDVEDPDISIRCVDHKMLTFPEMSPNPQDVSSYS